MGQGERRQREGRCGEGSARRRVGAEKGRRGEGAARRRGGVEKGQRGEGTACRSGSVEKGQRGEGTENERRAKLTKWGGQRESIYKTIKGTRARKPR